MRLKCVERFFLRVAALCICACFAAVPLTACSSEQSEQDADFTGVRAVSELSTLKCYYHNVATVDVPASGPLGDLLKMGYKRIWIEYSGTVEIGIKNVSDIYIGTPNANGVVEVYVPQPEIISVNLDKESIGDPITETGLFTGITAEEKMAGIAAAQENMQKTAEQDQALLTQAFDRARRLIKGYIENVGTAAGREYTVQWLSQPVA